MQAVSSAGFGTARHDTRAEDDLVPGSKILGGKSSCKRGSMPMKQDMAEIKNVAAVGIATLASLGAGLGVAWLCLSAVIRSMSRHTGAGE